MQFGWEGAVIGDFLRTVYDALRDADKRWEMIRILLFFGAFLSVIPLTVNSYIFFPGYISAPMAGQVAGDYDSASGKTPVTYKTAEGETRDYEAFAELPKDKPVDVCESLFGRPFLCKDIGDRRNKFQKNFLWLLTCLGYMLWFTKFGLK